MRCRQGEPQKSWNPVIFHSDALVPIGTTCNVAANSKSCGDTLASCDPARSELTSLPTCQQLRVRFLFAWLYCRLVALSGFPSLLFDRAPATSHLDIGVPAASLYYHQSTAPLAAPGTWPQLFVSVFNLTFSWTVAVGLDIPLSFFVRE